MKYGPVTHSGSMCTRVRKKKLGGVTAALGDVTAEFPLQIHLNDQEVFGKKNEKSRFSIPKLKKKKNLIRLFCN